MFSLRIIEYGSTDYQAMVALRDEILRKPLGLSFSEEYLQQEMHDTLIGCFTRERGIERIIGCCILSKVNDSTLQLRQMAVDKSHQGQGIGNSILTFAEQQAKNNSFSKLMMHARKEAVGFYERQGYTIDGDEFIEVDIPHYEMSRQL
ncbi:GNAT family N-acetyltransferase [Chitinophaga horti]|uniref:GNAT family N-acetyltransferase n=1 Tax=Chitinophaga horti TaxID=2920382 RepID=A0ABY6J0G6_9BACT|nr:GNAT family N-acetyltransferase [Chitinophaga horti]UYQ93158.1 GNAT family N-acetyltransferase [Chitinophaga horti]